MYLLLGGSGLRALENYNVEDQVSSRIQTCEAIKD